MANTTNFAVEKPTPGGYRNTWGGTINTGFDKLTELLALAQACKLFISGDTGPLHLAASVGTPIVALFGPTRPERNGPWAESDVVVSRVDQCSCVHERRCRLKHPCINDITVSEVIAAVDRCVLAHS